MEEVPLAGVLLLLLLRIHVSRFITLLLIRHGTGPLLLLVFPARNCAAALAAPCPARIDAAAARVFNKYSLVMKLADLDWTHPRSR